jgi:hypothetical protein
MRFPSTARIPLVGLCAGCALSCLLVWLPALTSIWLTGIGAGIITGYLTSKYPVRRLTPTDLRNASVAREGARQAYVEGTFAPKFIWPLPELTIIAGCSFVAASVFAIRVETIFGKEVAGSTVPCAMLGGLCGVLAGREMLRFKTNEFVLRARQYPAWKHMLFGRAIVIACAACGWLLVESRIPGLTERNYYPWYRVNTDPPRGHTISRSYSQSGAVVIEIRETSDGAQTLWARDRRRLQNRSLVETYHVRLTMLISPDDSWLAVTHQPRSEQANVDLFEQVNAGPDQLLTYRRAPSFRNETLSTKVRLFYSEVTGEGARMREAKSSVTASEWNEEKLKLILTLENLPPSRRVEAWVCTYSPVLDKLEAVSSIKVVEHEPSSDEKVVSSATGQKAVERARDQSPRGLSGTFQTNGGDVLPGERYPETRQRLLSEPDVAEWPEDKLRYAINEMFARRGADLLKPDLNKWFSQFEWYRNTQRTTIEIVERERFSDLERRNMEILGMMRARKRGN